MTIPPRDPWSSVGNRHKFFEVRSLRYFTTVFRRVIPVLLLQVEDIDGLGLYRVLSLQKNATTEEIKKVGNSEGVCVSHIKRKDSKSWDGDSTLLKAALSIAIIFHEIPILLCTFCCRLIESVRGYTIPTKAEMLSNFRGSRPPSRLCLIPESVLCTMNGQGSFNFVTSQE